MPALGHIYGEGWKGNGELCSPTIVNPLNEHNQPRQQLPTHLFAQCHEISWFFFDGVPNSFNLIPNIFLPPTGPRKVAASELRQPAAFFQPVTKQEPVWN